MGDSNGKADKDGLSGFPDGRMDEKIKREDAPLHDRDREKTNRKAQA